MERWKKDTALFLGSQSLSLFGSSLVQYAIMWYITLETKSGVMMTLSILCGFLPALFLSPVAGVWADRYNRKHLIILADGMIALTTLVLALLFLFGKGSIWLLFVMSAVRSMGTGIQTPAIGAILPQFVPLDKLTRVNGINSMIQSAVMLLSPMASGALLTMTALENIFFVDVVTAALAIFILGNFFHVTAHKKALSQEKDGYWKDFLLGLAYIRNHSFLVRLYIFFSLYFVMLAPAAFLTPLQVARSFGEDVWRLTLIEIAFSVGMMVGGAWIASWGGFRNRIHTVVLGGLFIGFSTVALGVIPYFAIYTGFMVLTGLAVPFFNTPCMVMIQEKVEEDFLGRVFGVISMISASMMPLGMMIFGPLADIVPIEMLLVCTGIVLFIQTFFLMGSKVLLEAGEPVTPFQETKR
jgi:DHA3 family macrolide efflux protein-like MFS transporter